jgi:hypothetical protein
MDRGEYTKALELIGALYRDLYRRTIPVARSLADLECVVIYEGARG